MLERDHFPDVNVDAIQMEVKEKVCEVLHWTQLADIGVCKCSCNLVVIDGVDSHLPMVDCLQLKKWQFARSRRMWDTVLYKVYGRLWARLDWLQIWSTDAFQHAMGNFLSTWTIIGLPKRNLFSGFTYMYKFKLNFKFAKHIIWFDLIKSYRSVQPCGKGWDTLNFA